MKQLTLRDMATYAVIIAVAAIITYTVKYMHLHPSVLSNH